MLRLSFKYKNEDKEEVVDFFTFICNSGSLTAWGGKYIEGTLFSTTSSDLQRNLSSWFIGDSRRWTAGSANWVPVARDFSPSVKYQRIKEFDSCNQKLQA